jgi:prepilin peptidase CpaA
MSFATALVLVPVLAVAVWFDARRRRIPNGLTLCGFAAALAFATLAGGVHGILGAVAGALTGAALLLPFYLAGGLGAGDVKLMGVVGACLGPVGAIEATLFALVAGALIALLKLIAGPVRNADRRLAGASVSMGPVRSAGALQPARKQQLPYAGAIAIGAVLAAWRAGIVATALGVPT